MDEEPDEFVVELGSGQVARLLVNYYLEELVPVNAVNRQNQHVPEYQSKAQVLLDQREGKDSNDEINCTGPKQETGEHEFKRLHKVTI